VTPETLESIVAKLCSPGVESLIPWMYRDDSDKGIVTAGAGHAIFSQSTAVDLPWTLPDGPAPVQTVIHDYQAVLAAPLGHTAGFYAQFSQCRLSVADCKALCATDMSDRWAKALVGMPDLDRYPEPVQRAIADLLYNAGAYIFANGHWPALTRAVLANDWAAAAVQSHRAPPISEDRNRYVQDLFLGALPPKPG